MCACTRHTPRIFFLAGSADPEAIQNLSLILKTVLSKSYKYNYIVQNGCTSKSYQTVKTAVCFNRMQRLQIYNIPSVIQALGAGMVRLDGFLSGTVHL